MALKREDYKAIKHMDKDTMTAYLERIYRRGYEVGYKASVEALAQKTGHSVTPVVAEPDSLADGGTL